MAIVDCVVKLFACCWRGLRDVPPIDGKFTDVGEMMAIGVAMVLCVAAVRSSRSEFTMTTERSAHASNLAPHVEEGLVESNQNFLKIGLPGQ